MKQAHIWKNMGFLFMGSKIFTFNKIDAYTIFIGSITLFYVIFSHYLQLNRSGVGLELPFNAMGWIPISWAIGVGLHLIAVKKQFYYDALIVKLFICSCFLAFPFFLPSANQDDTFDRIIGLFAGLLLLVSLQQFQLNEDKKITLLLLVVIAVWVELIIGWDRFLRSLGIGISESRPIWMGAPHGIFQQRNVFASFIATGVVLSAYILGYSGKVNGKVFKAYYIVLVLLPAASIHLLTAMASRTGWLGVLLGTTFILPFMVKNASRIISICWISSVVAGFLITMTLEQKSQWEAPQRELVDISGLRQVHFPQTIGMISEKPLFGYGYGTFESSYLYYAAEKFANEENKLPGVSLLDHPHNEIMFWGAEGGLYAIALLLLMAWAVWKRVVVLPVIHLFAVIGIFFPIVLHTQVEYPFYQSVLHWVTFVIFIYWADQLTSEFKIINIETVLAIRFGAFLIPVVGTIFLVTTLHAGYLLARFDSGIDPDVEKLASISNPMVFRDRINWAIMSRLVLQGAIYNRPELVQPYIDLAPDLLARKPRPNFYRFLMLAYQVVGDQENFQKTLNEARYLFPDTTFDIPRVVVEQITSAPFEVIDRNPE